MAQGHLRLKQAKLELPTLGGNGVRCNRGAPFVAIKFGNEVKAATLLAETLRHAILEK